MGIGRVRSGHELCGRALPRVRMVAVEGTCRGPGSSRPATSDNSRISAIRTAGVGVGSRHPRAARRGARRTPRAAVRPPRAVARDGALHGLDAVRVALDLAADEQEVAAGRRGAPRSAWAGRRTRPALPSRDRPRRRLRRSRGGRAGSALRVPARATPEGRRARPRCETMTARARSMRPSNGARSRASACRSCSSDRKGLVGVQVSAAQPREVLEAAADPLLVQPVEEVAGRRQHLVRIGRGAPLAQHQRAAFRAAVHDGREVHVEAERGQSGARDRAQPTGGLAARGGLEGRASAPADPPGGRRARPPGPPARSARRAV